MTAPTNATFGIEIECHLPEGITFSMAAAALTARGVTCTAMAYNHATQTGWKVVTDGSLGANGAEFVSPVLSGVAGLDQVAKAMRALTDLGCTVNKNCGLHVHIGVPAAQLDFWKRLAKLYAMFEPVIDRMMPSSRRANNNTYCRSHTGMNLASLNAATTFAQVRDIVSLQRYAKVNLHSYQRYSTVEFRQHSGTLDTIKATNWILICQRLVETARHEIAGFGQATPAAAGTINRARVGSKSHTVGQMMLRPEGVTGPEAQAATGWPSISMPQQAAICGLAFTTQRIGRTVRYFAVQAIPAAVPQTAVQITPDGFASIIGADSELRGYIRQRISDLGGAHAWAA
jgi:hypothetical protein